MTTKNRPGPWSRFVDWIKYLQNGLNCLWIPLRIKITLPYFIMAFLLALGAGYVVTRVVFDSVSERFANQLIESGKLSSEWMVHEEELLLETLRLLAHTQGVGEALLAGDAEQLRLLAYPIAVGHREDAVEFLDAHGNLVLSMRHRAGGSLEDYQTFRSGGDLFRDYPFVTAVLERQQDDHGDKFSGLVQAGWGDYFYIAGPVYDQSGNYAGVILVGKTLKNLVRAIHDASLAQITLYDFHGRPMASTFFESPNLSPGEVSLVIESQDHSSMTRDLAAMQQFSPGGLDYVEVLAPLEARNNQDLGLIGVSLMKTFLVRASRLTRLEITLIVGSAFLLVILLGINISNFVTQPLLGLVIASKEVAAGNLQVQVAADSNDEISILASSFNIMTSSLQRSKFALVKAYDDTLEGWAKALELRNAETEGHSSRVTGLALALATSMGLNGEALANLRRGALLHDIGKMGVPDEILLKPSKLTEDEWLVMRQHPRYAFDMLSQIEYLRPALDVPYCHHENWDGNGYPRGLSGEQIPLSARIFSVVDMWDALLSQRPYRDAVDEKTALALIRQESGTKLDPKVVDAFIRLIEAREFVYDVLPSKIQAEDAAPAAGVRKK